MNPKWLNRSPLRQHVNPRGVAKRSFESSDTAAIYASDLQTRPGASKRRPYRAYLCGTCAKWHVGRRQA